MKTKTGASIQSIIQKNGQVRPHDLVLQLGISEVAVHNQLRKLVTKGKLRKIGKPPRVYYIVPELIQTSRVTLLPQDEKVISERYLYIDPTGTMMYGVLGFVYWGTEINKSKNLQKLASSFVETRTMADRFMTAAGWIDGTEKIRSTFPTVHIDSLIYQDFYSLPVFGKTILGQLVLYAKISQDRKLIATIASQVRQTVVIYLIDNSIDFVAYIPATIPRNIQFMTEFARQLALPKPAISLVKLKVGDVIVAQKTLSKLEERVSNARGSIMVSTSPNIIKGKRILLIDDAVGSGASMNETARKLKIAGATFVAGFAPVGSFKGFDVLKEL
jgi:hypothetical protein